MTNLKKVTLLGLALFVAIVGLHGIAFAASSSVSHSVTVSVPSQISITADTTNFTLTMADFIAGSESDTKTVNYTVKANKVTAADGATVLKGQLNALFTGLDLKGDVGTYASTGGNSNLAEATAGFITIGNTATDLAKKTVVSGSGQIIRGSLPITYKAFATADLTAADQVKTLTLTFSET